jgi:hypothetical protein
MNRRHRRDLLRHAAQRAEHQPFFVASALAAYRALHNLNETELAAFLGCTPEALPRLALCRLPDASTPRFRPEVERIASFSGVNSLHLAILLRDVDSTTALRRLTQSQRQTPEQGFLLAARDRPQETDAGETTGREEQHQPDTEADAP